MSTYIGYMGTNDLIAGDISVSSITADEAIVVGDIKVGGLVDGVDVKQLGETVAQHSIELKDHEERIVELENHEITDVVNLTTDQTVGGLKTFTTGIISRGILTTHNNSIVVNPLYPAKDGTVRMGVGMIGGANDADLILAGTETSVMFNNHHYFEAQNMNYDITCSADKKLKFNRGTAFPTANEMLTLDGAANTVDVKADRFVVSKNRGQVTSGIGIRSHASRAQQFVISNGDNVAEIYLGSDSDGTGYADANIKWCISSRTKGDGKLNFYCAPSYTNGRPGVVGPGGYEEVMSFQNIQNGLGDYRVINMQKQLNVNGGMTVKDSDYLELKLGSGSNTSYTQYARVQIQRIANTVTMTCSLGGIHVVSAAVRMLTAALPAVYRPTTGSEFVVSIAAEGSNAYRTVPAFVDTDGVIVIYGQMNVGTGTFGAAQIKFGAFSHSWVTGLAP